MESKVGAENTHNTHNRQGVQNWQDVQVSIAAPTSEQLPPRLRQDGEYVRSVHGETWHDPYEWVRDVKNPAVQRFIEEENAYTQQRLAPLAPLREQLFQELKSRVQETDMSVPTRVHDYWYFSRIREGQQYAVQCRLPIRSEDDWQAPEIDAQGLPGSLEGETVVFDPNAESQGHDFFRLGDVDLSRDGVWMAYGVDTQGDERYTYRVRNVLTGQDVPGEITNAGGACLSPDGQWLWYVELDDAWRPCAVWRHKVHGSGSDVEVYRETDERFWVSVGLSSDERYVTIGSGSKTTSEVWLLPVNEPEGAFQVVIPRQDNVEYDVSFASFERAECKGGDIPLLVLYHNARNPNFEVDLIDLREHKPPYRFDEGVCVAQGSPYGCEEGDAVAPHAREVSVTEAWHDAVNPPLLQGSRGLAITGFAMYRHYVLLEYRAQGLPQSAIITKAAALKAYLARQPWAFEPIVETGDGEQGKNESANSAALHSPLQSPLSTVLASGSPSYENPRVRYLVTSFIIPSQLRERDVLTDADSLLKQAQVRGGYDWHDYREAREWVRSRDGVMIPVSLVWKPSAVQCGVSDNTQNGNAQETGANNDNANDSANAHAKEGSLPQHAPMLINGYGAYGYSLDPAFSVSRLSLLDRGVVYAVVHARGGGEFGRAWYEQGRRLQKKHTFEDFIDATAALQRKGIATPERTVARGGSAGGLLMGAIANMAPELYAGIEAEVPFVDALTSILNPALPLTVIEWDEWGDPLHDKQVYDYMRSYTPYENVPEHVEPQSYPQILALTSMNDTRVLVVEPLKWIARLQAAGADALVKIQHDAGHGGGSGRYQQWKEIAYSNAWCLSVLLHTMR